MTIRMISYEPRAQVQEANQMKANKNKCLSKAIVILRRICFTMSQMLWGGESILVSDDYLVV